MNKCLVVIGSFETVIDLVCYHATVFKNGNLVDLILYDVKLLDGSVFYRVEYDDIIFIMQQCYADYLL